MQQDEDAETLRRVDALGDGPLSQALREALARRSNAARVEAMNDDERAAWDASEAARLDAWIPDLSNQLDDAERESLNTFYTDEAAVRLVVPPFALLQLHPYMRRKVLAFLLCASHDHALRADAAKRVTEMPDAIKLENTRSFLHSPPLSGNEIAVFSNRGASSTVLRGAAPRSTAASVDALFHHTAALRVVCRELRTDAVALSNAANSEATPRSWLANLYCRRDTALDDAAVISELRARVLSGRRANTVRDLFLRKDACFVFTPPEQGRASIYNNFAGARSSSRNARVLCTSAPSGWSERRSDMARLLAFLSSTSRSSLGAARAAHACTRVLTVDEANRNAPVDEELLQSLSNAAVESALTSFRGSRVTLVAESVYILWVEGESSGPSPPSDCYARLEEQLGQFFGDRSGDGWITRWTNKPPLQVYDDHVGKTISSENYAETSHYYHDSSRPPITALEDVMANATETKLTKNAFTALVDVEFASDMEPSLRDEGLGIFRQASYTIDASSMKFQAGTLVRRDCYIEVQCCRGAMDSVELSVPFLREPGDALGDGYFYARVRARIPGFD